MKFIAILIGLFIERYWGRVQELRDIDPFVRYCKAARSWFGDSTFYDGIIGVLLLFVFPLMFVGWVQQLLSHGWLVLFGLLFAVTCLIASIGPKDLGEQVKEYLSASAKQDDARADEIAGELLDGPVPVAEGERNYKLISAVFAKTNDWLPAVLFWFVLLGPMGAVMFRLACVVKDCCDQTRETTDFSQVVHTLYGILAWAPSRITAFAFSVTGSFVHAKQAWREELSLPSSHWLTNHHRVLIASGFGALQLDAGRSSPTDANLSEALGLVRRAIMVWLTAIALVTLMGIV